MEDKELKEVARRMLPYPYGWLPTSKEDKEFIKSLIEDNFNRLRLEEYGA